MSRLKLEHGVSRVQRTKLQTSIDQSIAEDIEMLAEWSNNETNYVVNELLRFALAHEEEFQKHKASPSTNPARVSHTAKSSAPNTKPSSDLAAKPDTAAAHA